MSSSTFGAANKLTLEGTFLSPQPTTDPIEFRLYGWGAGSSLDNTHVTAASMRARFASVVGVPIDPTGSISVQGDFYHLAGGQITIDLGGHTAGVDYDTINIFGKADLAGDLTVALANAGGSAFAPSLGDSFQILSATQGRTGQFAHVTLPQLAWDLDWQVNYLSTAVTLSVITTGDFNKNGVVDAADYAVWRKNGGTQTEFEIWRNHYGETVTNGAGLLSSSTAATSVPEPASFLLTMCVAGVGFGWRRRKQ